MVIIHSNAQSILNGYVDKYVDYRYKDEHGISSFWYWYYQVKNYINILDKYNTPIGNNLVFKMPQWGNIYFSREIVANDIFVVVTDFDFNHSNFRKWINHKFDSNKTNTKVSQPIGTFPNEKIKLKPLGFNGLYKAIMQDGKCYLCDKHANRIGPKNISYDSISNFRQIKGHYPYAIAVLNGQKTFLGQDGYPLETQMSYANMRDRRNSEKLGGMTMAQYHNLKTFGDSKEPKSNILTERLKYIIDRTVRSVLKEHIRKTVRT